MSFFGNDPDWLALARRVDSLSASGFDPALVAEFQRYRAPSAPIRFYAPSFKTYASSEIAACGGSAWPAVSVTGAECKLQCDHCKGRLLESMIPARRPEDLWRVASEQAMAGARGMLLSGGSNHRDEVDYGPFYPVLRRIKDCFPAFKIAVHAALADRDAARRMEDAGIDVAMLDVIGAQDTLTQVYHLRRPVEDFERTLEHLVATRLKVVPHVVLGLHYGRFLGEWNALEMIRRHPPAALVLVVVMPFYAAPARPFVTPDSVQIGRFFLDARRALPDIPLLLGCARPPGRAKAQIDSYAVMAGLDGIAHPADGVVELAARLGREVGLSPACCSMAAVHGDMLFGGEQPELTPEVRRVIGEPGLAGIKVVASGCGG